MPVTIHLSGGLRQLAGGRESIEIGGAPETAGDALEALWALCPALRDRVATEQGDIREHVNVFVGQENVRYSGGLATPLSAAAEMWILPSITGG